VKKKPKTFAAQRENDAENPAWAGERKRKPKGPKLKLRTEAEYQELRSMTVELANCAVLVLQTRGKLGVGSGMIFNGKTKKLVHWTTRFFDALDAVGISYDRDVYLNMEKKKPCLSG